MAITRIGIDFSFDAHQVIDKGIAAGLGNKEAMEVFFGWQALRPWGPIFEAKRGKLRAMVNHSNPDDPPDLMFQFAFEQLFGN
jgi:hypothetical protein